MTTPAPDDVRHCIKCGREIGRDETICEVCNRAGMATPSATQYHGTVVVAIVAAVVGLAIAASLSLRGVGPFAATVSRVVPASTVGYEVTLVVQNDGTRQGRAKCQIVALPRHRANRRRWLGDRHRAPHEHPGGAGRRHGHLLVSARRWELDTPKFAPRASHAALLAREAL